MINIIISPYTIAITNPKNITGTNGNDTKMLLITTLNENGYTDNYGKIFKKLILRPYGIYLTLNNIN